jgi:hypothetical protein
MEQTIKGYRLLEKVGDMRIWDKVEKICECGDSEKVHIDGCEQCCIPECGCKEFQEKL